MIKLNLYFGLILFIIFLLTGYYLQVYFKPQHIDNLPLRMEIRANHIYILFISLLNILAFKCTFSKNKKISAYLEASSRTLLIASGIMALYAFMYDHNGDLTDRDETLATIIFALSAIILLLANECIEFVYAKNNI